MIWIRPRVDGPNTYVWQKAYAATEYNYLNNFGDVGTIRGVFGSGGHTTTQFMVHDTGQTVNNDNANSNGVAYTAYIWAEIPGFSCFTSFMGNGNADGPFIHTGFRPAMICSKRMKGAATNNGWHTFNSLQPNYNPVGELTIFDKPSNPGNAFYVDLLSNGFKMRTTDGNHNASGAAFAVFAFAEMAFGGSNVSPAPAR